MGALGPAAAGGGRATAAAAAPAPGMALPLAGPEACRMAALASPSLDLTCATSRPEAALLDGATCTHAAADCTTACSCGTCPAVMASSWVGRTWAGVEVVVRALGAWLRCTTDGVGADGGASDAAAAGPAWGAGAEAEAGGGEFVTATELDPPAAEELEDGSAAPADDDGSEEDTPAAAAAGRDGGNVGGDAGAGAAAADVWLGAGAAADELAASPSCP